MDLRYCILGENPEKRTSGSNSPQINAGEMPLMLQTKPLFGAPGSRAKPVPLYALKRQVRLQGRGYLAWVMNTYGGKVGQLFDTTMAMGLRKE